MGDPTRRWLRSTHLDARLTRGAPAQEGASPERGGMSVSEMKVPEDLKDQHRIYSTGKNVRPTAEEHVNLIERIAKLEAENAALKATVERMDVSLAGISGAAIGCGLEGVQECVDKRQWAFHPTMEEVLNLRKKYEAFKAALSHVWEVSSGERQVAMDYMQGMEYLCDYVSSVVGDPEEDARASKEPSDDQTR